MLSAGNPYVLPSVVVGAAAYLGLTVLTDYSLLVRLGALVGIVGVLPVLLNTVRPGEEYDDVGWGVVAEAGDAESPENEPADETATDAPADAPDGDAPESRST